MMKQNIILVFALLFVLSMVNAIPHKRATSFVKCPVDPPAPLLSVSLSPDPPAAGKDETFTISGSDIKVPDNAQVEIAFLDATFGLIAVPFDTPIKSGPLGTVTEKVSISSNLPAQYALSVSIRDIHSGEFLYCAVALFGGLASPSADVVFAF